MTARMLNNCKQYAIVINNQFMVVQAFLSMAAFVHVLVLSFMLWEFTS